MGSQLSDPFTILSITLYFFIGLAAIAGAINVIRRVKFIFGNDLPGGNFLSLALHKLFRVLFLPVTRSPEATFLVSVAAALALVQLNYGHYFSGVGSALFGSEYHAALLGVLAFVASSILSTTSVQLGRVHTHELEIYREIMDCVEKLDELAEALDDADFPKPDVLSATVGFRELRPSDLTKETPQHELIKGIRELTEKLVEQKKSGRNFDQFLNYALRLDHACYGATLNFVRYTVSGSIWTRMAITLFSYLAIVIGMLIMLAFANQPPFGAIADGIFVAISVATAISVADLVSHQIQETRD